MTNHGGIRFALGSTQYIDARTLDARGEKKAFRIFA